MSYPQEILNVLHCLRLNSKLHQNKEGLTAERGDSFYPFINGIAWSFKFPLAALYNWQAKIRQFIIQSEKEIKNLKQELTLPNLFELTKQRIEQKIAALETNTKTYKQLFADFLKAEVSEALFEEVMAEAPPFTQQINSYQDNVFRDWAWGKEEIDHAFEIILNKIDRAELDDMVVLGSGGGALPLKLHKALVKNWTLALDINPSLVLTAKHLFDGNSLHLHEFPMDPLETVNYCVKHELEPIDAKNFHLMFADAVNSPLKNGSVSSIFTPWFIDIINEPFKNLCHRINRPLKKQGLWIHHGPLTFSNRPFSEQYSAEEVLEIVEKKGFKIKNWSIDQIPYLKSPYSGRQRLEKVLTFTAEKTDSLKQLQSADTWPSWITNLDQPIPKNEVFEDILFKNHTQAQILSVIDGKNSIKKITLLMVQHFEMDRDSALNSLVSFLKQIYELHMKKKGFTDN